MIESDADKAWLACLIDSEGNLHWSLKGGYFYIVIGISNTDPNILVRALEIVGHGNLYRRNHSKVLGYHGAKPLFVIVFTGRVATAILRAVEPFMIVKQAKARKLLLAEQNTKRRKFTASV